MLFKLYVVLCGGLCLMFYLVGVYVNDGDGIDLVMW